PTPFAAAADARGRAAFQPSPPATFRRRHRPSPRSALRLRPRRRALGRRNGRYVRAVRLAPAVLAARRSAALHRARGWPARGLRPRPRAPDRRRRARPGDGRVLRVADLSPAWHRHARGPRALRALPRTLGGGRADVESGAALLARRHPPCGRRPGRDTPAAPPRSHVRRLALRYHASARPRGRAIGGPPSGGSSGRISTQPGRPAGLVIAFRQWWIP